MASAGGLESTLGPLPADIKAILLNYTRAWVRSLRFGAPTDEAERAENFGGTLVPFTTAAVANAEVAIAHRLDRVPRLIITGLIPADVVNATTPVLTQTRAADITYVYLKSATQGAACWVYVE